MNRRQVVVAIGSFLLALQPVCAYATVDLGGRLQQEIAYRTGLSPTVTKSLSFLQLEATARFRQRMQLTAIGRVHYDAALDAVDPDELNPRLAPGDPVGGHPHGAELKEAYLDLFYETVDLRLGRQIVRWGVLEGARITDRINPIDFREYLFRDVEDRYIPLWMATLNYYPGWGQLQLLLIPDMTFNKPAPAGSEWEAFQTPPGTSSPSSSPKNTEVGINGGIRAGEVAINASYFYTWDDFPAAFRSIFGVVSQPTGVGFNARHERLHVFGLSVTQDVGKSVLSFEGAYDHGKYLATDIGAMPANEIQRDMARWGIGLDLNISGVDVSTLYFQEHVLHWRPFIPARRTERAASIMVSEKFLNNRLDLQMLLLYFGTGDQYIARPQAAWRVTDRVKVTVGADILGGERSADPSDPAAVRDFRFVGYFREHDRVHVTVNYRF